MVYGEIKMSEETQMFYVWLKQDDRKVALAKETKDMREAEHTARVLNDLLQTKARIKGFHYVIEVNK